MALENPWPQAVASGFVREKIQKVVYVSICLIHEQNAAMLWGLSHWAFQGFCLGFTKVLGCVPGRLR